MTKGSMEGHCFTDGTRVVFDSMVRLLCGILKHLALGLSVPLSGGIKRLPASLAPAAVALARSVPKMRHRFASGACYPARAGPRRGARRERAYGAAAAATMQAVATRGMKRSHNKLVDVSRAMYFR